MSDNIKPFFLKQNMWLHLKKCHIKLSENITPYYLKNTKHYIAWKYHIKLYEKYQAVLLEKVNPSPKPVCLQTVKIQINTMEPA